MKTFLSYDFIQIGLITRFLMNLEKHNTVKVVLAQYGALEAQLEAANLNVSLSGLQNINLLTETMEKIRKLDEKATMSDELCSQLKQQLSILEKIIFSESRTKNLYIIPERRYNSGYLLNQPEKLLKENLFGKLSDIAKYDFAAACRCLSFGEGTACAFHILRATEDILKEYYFKYKKTKRLAKPMWGPMTNELRNKKKPKPDDTILSALDVVRISYRNPTQHPQITYDLDSAQDLFGVCIDLINKMAQEL
ncbi:hypothetical protein [Flavobacterium wongokense]|uniref:hypothetical protein n=1 Tax=Flavobacterium wongokense TaxID=2910674 RepID=UPI001F1E59DE|nr:hypothetical protein [Flavobacterium sp. WG47]MCF6132478.1 hypothetical protein [Flavobacterium sp. WG47]